MPGIPAKSGGWHALESDRDMMTITMLDESTFEMPSKEWEEAFQIKYGDDKERAIEEFKQAVAHHWRNRTIPTKFGWDVSWDDAGDFDELAKREYLNHADLGRVVLYCSIRAALMGLILHRLSGGKSKVLAMNQDGNLIEYGEKSRRLKKWPKDG